MILEIYTKNFARTMELQVEAQHVPRVGETVTLEQDGGYLQGTTELLVHDVTHVLRENKLTPLVKCHACNGSTNRRMILAEGGWI